MSALSRRSPGRYVCTSRSCRPAIPSAGGGPSSCQAGDGSGHEVGVEQVDARLGGEDLHQLPVALAGLRGGRLEQTCGAHGCRAALPAHGAQSAGRRAHAGNVQPARQLVGDVALVAGERLVSAVAGQRDGDVSSRRLAHEVERQRGVVSERLVECLGEPRQRAGHVLLEHDLLVLRGVALGDGAGVAALVVALVAEADRERPHGVRRRLRHEADDDARVDASGEQRPERHVGDQAAAHGCLHALADEREPVTLALRRQLLEPGVALDANVAALGHEHVPGRQLLDAR